MRLGFGVSGPHGEPWFAERKLIRLVETAIAGGVRHFDTAPFYGQAEERLGRALAAIGADGVIISTKTGTRRESGRIVKDFSEAGIRRDVEESRNRLMRDRLDMLYLHGPDPAVIDATLPVLSALKAEGKITAFGVCGEGVALDHAVDVGVDAIMGVYNVAARGHEAVFRRARAGGVASVAIAPLVSGALAPSKPAITFSGGWKALRGLIRPRPEAGEGRAVRERLQDAGVDPVAGAYAFALGAPFVDLTLTTTSRGEHLAAALGWAGAAPDRAILTALAALGLDPAGAQP